jgi:ComF family protein
LRGTRAGVCSTCWDGVLPHSGSLCPVCGTPEVTAGELCLACRIHPPPWHAAASFGPYSGVLRALVLLFKNRGRDDLAVPLADYLVAAQRRAGWETPTTVVPVPMTWGRCLRRGYNQAELVARELARKLCAPCARILRRRGRGTQVGGTRSERLRLSAAAFPVRSTVAGRVLLVDDVLTTGATAAACARSLRRAGAEKVYVLTIARTAQPGRIP